MLMSADNSACSAFSLCSSSLLLKYKEERHLKAESCGSTNVLHNITPLWLDTSCRLQITWEVASNRCWLCVGTVNIV